MQLYHKLQLQHQPVLCANLLDELKCALAPEEVFLLVLQVVLQKVVGGAKIKQIIYIASDLLKTLSLFNIRSFAIEVCFSLYAWPGP